MTEQPAPRIDRHVCHVCQSPATVTDDSANRAAKRLDCPQCGTYSVSDSFFAYVFADEHWIHIKPLLSRALRWASAHGTPVVLRNGADVGTAVAAYHMALEQDGE